MARCVAKARKVKGAAIIAKAAKASVAPVLRARRDRAQTKLYQAPDSVVQKKPTPKKLVAVRTGKKVVTTKSDKKKGQDLAKVAGGKVQKAKKVAAKPKKGNDRLKRRDEVKYDEENPFFHSSTVPEFVSVNTYYRWLIRALVRGNLNELKTVMKSKKIHSHDIHKPFSYADSRTAAGLAIELKDAKFIEEYKKLREAIDDKKTIQGEPNLLKRKSTGQRNFYMLGRATRAIEMSRGGREGNNAFLNYEEGHVGDRSGLLALVEGNTSYKELLRLSQFKNSAFSIGDLETFLVHAVRCGHCELAHAIASAEAQHCTNELQRESLKIGGRMPQKILAASVIKKCYGNANFNTFHSAAINPDGAKMLAQLRTAEPNINVPDNENWYTIHYAAVNRHPGALEFLLKNGASATMLTKKQLSPLHVAAIAGRAETTKVLLEAIAKLEKVDGAEGPKPEKSLINARTRAGDTALLLAVKHGRANVVKTLLANETTVVDAPSSTSTNKLTPLMVACSLGNLELVKLLVEKGALIEGKDKKRRTALHHAVLNGQQHAAAYLLAMGADLIKGDSSGNTPAHYAAAYGWLNCLQLLADVDPECLSKENDWKITPLTVAFLKGQYGIVSWLLDGKYKEHVDINGKDTEGYTLLSCLLAFSDPDVHSQLPEQIDYLLNRGADCSLTDSYENTILHDFASLKVKLIGPGQKETDRKGMTEKQYQQCFEKLVEKAPDAVNRRNKNGETPIHLALQNGNLMSFKWMLDKVEIKEFFKEKWGPNGNILHSLLAVPCSVSNELNGEDGPSKHLYDILPVLKRLQTECPQFKDWLGEKNEANQEPALALITSFAAVRNRKLRQEDVTLLSDYVCSTVSWICDLVPETPCLLAKGKEEDSKTVSLLASTFSIPVESNSSKLLKTLLQKAVESKKIGKVLRQEINEVPLIFSACQNSTVAEIILRFAKENNCTKGVHDAVLHFEGDGKDRKEINKSLLMYLIEQKEFDLVSLLEMDADAWKAKDIEGNSAWHYAAKSSHHRTFGLMKTLEGKKIPREINAKGFTPLHVAVQACDGGANSVLEPIEWLVTKSNVADQDNFGRTAMHYAFGTMDQLNKKQSGGQARDPISVVSILAMNVTEKDVNVPDCNGNTVLHLAAACGANICCVTLLRKGAKVDVKNKDGNTPLGLAVLLGRQGVALTLIQANSNVTDKVHKGRREKAEEKVEWVWNSLKQVEAALADSSIPALIVEKGTDWASMVYVLLDTLGKNATSLAQIIACALREKQYNLANQLLKSLGAILDGQPVNSAEDLVVIFSESCHTGSLEVESVERTVLERLLSIGCPILKDGASPALEIALFNLAFPLADFFKERMGQEAWNQLKPVNPDEGPLKALLATSTESCSEFSRWLDYIIALGHLNATRCSLTLPVPKTLNGLVDGKFTALGWAALNGSADLIYFLRAKGFDVNVADELGRTPLMLAILANREKAVEALCDANTAKAVAVKKNKNVVQIKMSLGNHLAFTMNGRKRKASESDDEDENEDEDEESDQESVEEEEKEDEEEDNGRTPIKKLKLTNKKLDLEARDREGRNMLHYLVEPVAWENTNLLNLFAKENKVLTKTLLQQKDVAGQTPVELAAERNQRMMAAAMGKISGEKPKIPPVDLPSVDDLRCPYDISADSAAFIEKFAKEHDKKKEEKPDDSPHKLSGFKETGVVVRDENNDQFCRVLLNKSDLSYGRFGFHNFYRLELIKRRDTDLWNVFTNWGRIGGGNGEYQNTPFTSLEAGLKEFCSIFKSKTGQEWLPLVNFVDLPKKYRLVKVDKSPTSLAELKLPKLKKEIEKDAVRAFVRDISDPDQLMQYQKNVRSSLSTNSPFGRVTKTAIEKGREILGECAKVAKEITDTTNDKAESQDNLLRLLNKANDLSSEFYCAIPIGNAEFSSLQRFDNENTINQALTQLNRMSEIEIAARILTGAAQREDVDRTDYVKAAMQCGIREMTPDEPMSQSILQWVHNTKNENHTIMGILDITPKVSVENFAKFANEDNQKFLLHGTRSVNLLSLLRDGFLVDPQNVQINGRLFGDVG